MDNMNEYTRKDISLDQLHSFKGHPFAIRYDDAMNHLLDSIRISGILEPLLVRPRANGGYEILSGHRRVDAAHKLGLGQVPCMIRDMNDNEATLVMTESNLTQREKLLPSEKAFAWKMRTEAARKMMLQKKGKSEDERATDIVAREMGVSPRQISRIVKLTELNRQFLDLLDKNELGLEVGIELAHLSTMEQRWIYDYIREHKTTLSVAIARELRRAIQKDGALEDDIDRILSGESNVPSIRLDYDRIISFYSPSTPVDTINDSICAILEMERQRGEGQYII